VEQSDPIYLVADEQPRLARELRDLPADVWSMPSRCEGWSNAQVLAHLVAGAELYRDSVSRALIGDAGPPIESDGRLMAVEEFPRLLPRRQEALARQPPLELLDWFAILGEQLADLYLRLYPADLNKRAWHPRGIFTIATFVTSRLYEIGFHGWDIHASVDPEADVRPELCAFLLRMVRARQVRNCRPDPNLEGRCRFEVDGRAWTIRVGGGALDVDSSAPTARATIQTDGSTYLLLATARRALADRRDRVAIEGDRRWAERLLDATSFRV